VLAETLGRAAARRSRELFSLDRAASELLEYYDQGVQVRLVV
jgi:hypothetical protein